MARDTIYDNTTNDRARGSIYDPRNGLQLLNSLRLGNIRKVGRVFTRKFQSWGDRNRMQSHKIGSFRNSRSGMQKFNEV